MSTIDDKYLGDRVKALEENITDTVTEGSTAVPTAGAVYSAIQSSGVQWLVPKPPAEASINDDFFISIDNYTNSNPKIHQSYTVINSAIRFDGGNTNLTCYLWFKKSAFNANSISDILSKILILPLANIYGTSNVYPYTDGIYESTKYSGFYVLKLNIWGWSNSDEYTRARGYYRILLC